MSQRSARAASEVVTKLLKAKGVSRDVLRNINQADRDSMRLLATVSQLARGDVTGIITMLAGLGPYGVAAAVALGTAAVAYGIYTQVTKEQPTEMYYWRYPK